MTCLWPSGKGASLPSWTGGFDSHKTLFIGGWALLPVFFVRKTGRARVPILQNDRGSSKGRTSVFEADDGGSNPSPRMVSDERKQLRGSCGWSRCLALNQAALVRFQLPEMNKSNWRRMAALGRPDRRANFKRGGRPRAAILRRECAGGWPGRDCGRSTVPIGMLRIGTGARPRSPASPDGLWK